MMTQPPLSIGPIEIGMFLLANGVIFFFCAPRFFIDLRRWRS